MIILIIVIQKLLIMLDLWVRIINVSNTKHLKKIDQELRPVAWHPTRVWDWCMSENEKKEVSSFFL